MKKFIVIIISIVIVFAFAACNRAGCGCQKTVIETDTRV